MMHLRALKNELVQVLPFNNLNQFIFLTSQSIQFCVSKFLNMKQLSLLLLRITFAVVVLPHGCQMLFGWFGGYGFSGTMQYFTQTEGLPWLVGFAVILLEFAGSLAILAGAATRFMALGMIGLFIGMIVTSHWNHGFFMNWSGSQAGEGFEYHLLVIGIAIALLIEGAGDWSVDARFTGLS